jgi:hypothetical protein
VTTAPVVLHIVRPYASVEEYLAAEAWTVDARSMLLIGESGLAPDTAVVFDVTLGDGSRPIKAEARVSGVVEPMAGRPGGLRVRFRRYGGPTKAFIERAMTFVASGVDTGPPPPPAGPPEPSAPGHSAPDASAPLHVPPAEPLVVTTHGAPRLEGTTIAAGVGTPSTSFGRVPVSPSGHPDVAVALGSLRARGDRMPDTPAQREYLLEKLRQRGQGEDVTMRYQRDD